MVKMIMHSQVPLHMTILKLVNSYIAKMKLNIDKYEGHLSVANWLYSIVDVNIHAENDGTFRLSCANGHLEVAQWLYNLGNVDIHPKNSAFRSAGVKSHLSVAQWIYGLGRVTIHAENDFACKWTFIYYSHLTIVQW
jgi:hypothetical protein